MLKKNNSEKKDKLKIKINQGNEIINRLAQLYQHSVRKMKYSSQINTDDVIIKEIPRLNKKLNKLKKKSNLNIFQDKNKKPFLAYISIDSLLKRHSIKQSPSNDHQTSDMTRKFTSPEKNINSNNFSSTPKYKLKSEIKTETERNRKSKYKLSDNLDEVNGDRNINLFYDKSESSYKKDIYKNYNNKYLLKTRSSKLVNKKAEKKNKKLLLNSSNSEPSLTSYGNKNSFSHKKKDYYTSMIMNDDIKSHRRDKLLQSSIQFYLHHLNYLTKRSRIKKEYIDFSKDKPKLISDLKRIQGIISFGKLLPKECITIQKQNKIHKMFKPKQTLGHSYDTKNIFTKGFIKKNSIKRLKELKLIKDNYNIINPKNEYYIPKDKFGNTIYPVYGQKKMLKNMMPKNYDYNTIISPIELLKDTYHPLLRFQKKIMNQHMNAINQEIGVTYNKEFTLIDTSKIPEKYQLCQELIDLQKDEKLIKLIRDLIDRNMDLKSEVAKALEIQKKEKEKTEKKGKKEIYKRFREIMLKASIHFKRLNISLDDFYSIPKYSQDNIDADERLRLKQISMQKNGQYFFNALKEGNTQEIIKLMNKNYFIMFYRDHFMQSPLHIISKRNLYKFISLFISRGADINAKDEGGRTPLFIAAQNNYLEFITILLFEIADPSIKNIEGEQALDVVTDPQIKIILERVKILHYFNKIGKIQNFNESIKNGLTFLYKEELGINFEPWFDENEEIIKESIH